MIKIRLRVLTKNDFGVAAWFLVAGTQFEAQRILLRINSTSVEYLKLFISVKWYMYFTVQP